MNGASKEASRLSWYRSIGPPNRACTVISKTQRAVSTFSQTYVLVIFNRNKVKATENLSAPIRKNGLEYEEKFQVERKRRFLAVIFVILLSRITIKNLPTFTCLLDYCRMHKHQTHQISHSPALKERAQQRVWGVTGCPWDGGQYCVELQHGTFLGIALLPTITELPRKPKKLKSAIRQRAGTEAKCILPKKHRGLL